MIIKETAEGILLQKFDDFDLRHTFSVWNDGGVFQKRGFGFDRKRDKGSV